jgi:hypothetical protein
MNHLSLKINEMNKTSIIPEPTETRILIDDLKELQLHRNALQIMERDASNIENFVNDLNGSVYPSLSESEQTIVDESTRLMLKHFLLLFKSFGNASRARSMTVTRWQN